MKSYLIISMKSYKYSRMPLRDSTPQHHSGEDGGIAEGFEGRGQGAQEALSLCHQGAPSFLSIPPFTSLFPIYPSLHPFLPIHSFYPLPPASFFPLFIPSSYYQSLLALLHTIPLLPSFYSSSYHSRFFSF